jgi:hypothetical protein
MKRASAMRGGSRQADEALTRTEVARQLRVSIATVRRMEGRELHPRRRRDGTRLFDATEVATIATSRAVRPNAGGEIAARACELFREGKGVVDVVIALRQSFDTVRSLFRAFLEEQGAVLVPGPIARDIEAEFCEGRALTPAALLQLLRAAEQRVMALAHRVGEAEQSWRDLEHEGALVVPGEVVREIERTCRELLSGTKLQPDQLLAICRAARDRCVDPNADPGAPNVPVIS